MKILFMIIFTLLAIFTMLLPFFVLKECKENIVNTPYQGTSDYFVKSVISK